MQPTIKKIILFMVIVSGFLLGFASCQKNGDLVKAPEVTNLAISVTTNEPSSRFRFTLDDMLIKDSVENGASVTKIVPVKEGEQRLTVRDIINNRILVDTTLQLKQPAVAYRLFELDTASKPLFVEDGSIVIHKDSCRMAFYFNRTDWEKEVDIYLYYAQVYPVYEQPAAPLYIFRNVRPDVLTEIITAPMNNPEALYLIVVKDSKTGELVGNFLNNQLPTDDVWNGAVASTCSVPGNEGSNSTNIMHLDFNWENNFLAPYCMLRF